MDWQVSIAPVKGKSDNPAFDLPEGRTFDVGTEQIVFGRETNCDVVFPPEARIVGRQHARLYRQASGDYAIEAFGNHYLEVNGYRPEQGQPITGDATIRFGNAKGPVVHVHMARQDSGSGLATTLQQEEVAPISKVTAQIKIAVAALAAVVVVVAGVLAVMTYLTNSRIAQVTRQMTDMRTAMSKQVEGTFPSTAFLRAAAFAVILENDQGLSRVIGTAWPLKAGMLVTNAHVAKVMDRLKPHERLYVRKPRATDAIPVTGKRIHPGYDAFNDFVDQATSQDFKSLTEGAAMPSAYDVAILEVDPGADLGGTLQVADDPAALSAGTPLAFAGYPIEGTGAQKLAQLSPNPVLQFGRVTALSDYFLFDADRANALLVENSLPATGGASGSPIVDASGKVVAVLSGGTVDFRDGVRSPSAVMLNYAQRADLIGDVLDPARFDLAAAKAEWQKALSLFDRHENTVIADARSALEKKTGGGVAESQKLPGSLKTSEAVTVGTLSYREHPVPVLAGHTYTFVAYGERSGTLNLMLLKDGKGVAAAYGSSWFSTLTYKADQNATLTLRVFGQAKHRINYDLVTLTGEKTVAAAAPAN